ncbi:MAG TPA: hypothetical protein VGC86_09540 [Afipia sp.]
MRVAGKTVQIAAVVIFTAATGLAASAPPAFAQGHKGSGASGPPPSPEEKMKKTKREEEERAAKAAMDRVPDSKVKYDPWKIER